MTVVRWRNRQVYAEISHKIIAKSPLLFYHISIEYQLCSHGISPSRLHRKAVIV